MPDPMRPLPIANLVRVAAPLRVQVVRALSDAILAHQLPPGQHLVERELMEHLGVSRATVREAIRELAADGLVTVMPQRGAIVTSHSVDDARDLYAMRASLEALLIERFIERALPAHADGLVSAVRGLVAVVESTADAAEIMAVRDQLYAALFAGAQSELLRQQLEGIQARVRVLCAHSLSERGRGAAAAAELSGVVEAIIAGDGVLAVQLMREHLRLAAEATIRTLQPRFEALSA